MPPESESPLRSLTATDVVVVAGKGGVGKTTVTAVVARAAADGGRAVLVVELDGKGTLDGLLPDVEVRHISAPAALDEYLHDHGFGRVAERLNRSGVIDLIGTAAPGIDDVVVLGKIKQLQRSGRWDLIVVDGPAAGHAVTFLTSASGLADAMPGGPVHVQASAVQQMLRDHEYLQVVLVTLPETTPVNEAIETAEVFRDRVGVRLGPVVVNGLDDGPPLPDEGAQTVALAFGLAAASIFPALMMGIFSTRINNIGAVAGMLVGLTSTVVYIFLHKGWFFIPGTNSFTDADPLFFTVQSTSFGALGAAINFAVAYIVAGMTKETPQEIKELVESVRVPRGAGTAVDH